MIQSASSRPSVAEKMTQLGGRGPLILDLLAGSEKMARTGPGDRKLVRTKIRPKNWEATEAPPSTLGTGQDTVRAWQIFVTTH